MNCKRIISFFLIMSLCMVFYNTADAAVSRTPRLSVKTLYIAKDSAYKLHIYNTKPDYTTEFTSSDSDIVVIKKSRYKNCRLKAKAIGTATVTAEVSDSEGNEVVTLKCKVTVSPTALSVKFTKRKVKLSEGRSRIVKAVVKPNISYEQPKYTSDDTDIATISSTGVVTAVSEGQTTIRATIANGSEATCIIVVNGKKPQDKTEKTPDVPSFSPSPTDSSDSSGDKPQKPASKVTAKPFKAYSTDYSTDNAEEL